MRQKLLEAFVMGMGFALAMKGVDYLFWYIQMKMLLS